MKNLPEDVKQRALKFMSEKALSQGEFARRAGLSRSTLSQWLTRKEPHSFDYSAQSGEAVGA